MELNFRVEASWVDTRRNDFLSPSYAQALELLQSYPTNLNNQSVSNKMRESTLWTPTSLLLLYNVHASTLVGPVVNFGVVRVGAGMKPAF
jgi:hypothetical protein